MSHPAGVPRALTIAGSDSGGGAGLQADLKTFAAFGVYGTTAVVALTAQNTVEVTAIHEVPPEMVRAQIEAVMRDIGADAVKTGMLASSVLVETVAGAIRDLKIPNLVVDPVMVSKAGAPLLRSEAVETLREQLLPLARVVTPNLPEAAALAGRPVSGPGEMREAARAIAALGPSAVIIKGGHAGGDPVDLLFEGGEFTEFPGPRIPTTSDHGTGCTFSAAIAAQLALGVPLREAVGRAKRFVTEAMRAGLPLGRGRGPLHHFHAFKPGN